MRRTDEPHAWPSPEDLGAYFDGTLDETSRRAIGRHVSTCEECLAALKDAGAYEREIEAAGSPGTSTAIEGESPLRYAPIAAAIVIAALGIVAVLLMRSVDPVRRLSAAVQQQGYRPFEGRLTGFEHVPFRATRSTEITTSPMAATANAILNDTAAHSAAEWHRAAIANLVLQKNRDAVAALELASQRAPESIDYRTDLAAARIALASETGDRAEFRRAVADSDWVLERKPHSLSALFNRAVALERLGENTLARAAYEAYLDADSVSAWAAEARRRLDRLHS